MATKLHMNLTLGFKSYYKSLNVIVLCIFIEMQTLCHMLHRYSLYEVLLALSGNI